MHIADQKKISSKTQLQPQKHQTSSGPESTDISNNIIQLQRTIGNEATMKYLKNNGNARQIARAQQAISSISSANRPIQRTGETAENPVLYVTQGMTKKYYHSEGDKHGWLETDDKTKKEEFGAYIKLGALSNLDIPSVKDATADEDLPYLKEKNGGVVKAQLGYWIEHVAFLKNKRDEKFGTIKPKMFSMGVNMTAKNIFAMLKQNDLLPTAIESLGFIKANIVAISKIVGELTLGVSSNGKMLLLDVGTIQNQAGGEELATLGGKGLDKMIEYATSLLPK